MERLEEIKEKIKQLAVELKQNQNLKNKAEKIDAELEQVLNERNNLIDKLSLAENRIQQLIEKIEQN